MTVAPTAAATKLTGTQKAALAMSVRLRPAESPAALATRPASAAPSAKPVCCTVATDEAARSASPGPRAAHDPLRDERPARADAGTHQGDRRKHDRRRLDRHQQGDAEQAQRHHDRAGDQQCGRCVPAGVPATTSDIPVQPNEAPATM